LCITDDSDSEDVWYEKTPKEMEQLRGLEECELSRFVEIFNKQYLQHNKVASVASIRLAECAAELERMRKSLADKNKECEILAATVGEADIRAREMAEDIKQVEMLKTRVREGEVAIKVQNEELRVTKDKLAQSLSKLGVMKVDLDIERTLVKELTQQVQDHDAERAGLITEVIPYACRALVDSDEVGQWFGPVISANRDEERAIILREFHLKGWVDLSAQTDYVEDATAKIEKAVQDYKCAEFPFVDKLAANPQASYHDLLLLKPSKLQAPVYANVPADVNVDSTPLKPSTSQASVVRGPSRSEPLKPKPIQGSLRGNVSS